MQALRLTVILSAFVVMLAVAPLAHATTTESVYRGEVLEIESFGERSIPGLRARESYQHLQVRITDGPRMGEVISAENTTLIDFNPGDALYLTMLPTAEGEEIWLADEPDRIPVLAMFAVLFVVLTALAGGYAGIRSIVALALCLCIILFALVPLLYGGANAVLTCVGLAFVMLVLSMIITHGFNRPTLAALAGSTAALAFASAVSFAAVAFARFTGLAGDENVYLNYATAGTLDLPGLLFGSILIGIVGVLNDISVSQAHTIVEIHKANPSLSAGEVLQRAMRVGREHIGAVINTLPLAYAGAALPLLLLFSTTDSLPMTINREVFATELIRILAGGIALSLSGALSTIVAAFLLVRRSKAA